MAGRKRSLIMGLATVAVFGVIVGLGLYTFVYAKGYSYLSSDPKACMNCHVMREVYEAWGHESHKSVAKCNDCHTPHHWAGKYAVKALNGWHHSYAFTTGKFKEPIEISEFSKKIVIHNCLYCHGDMVASIHHPSSKYPTDCIRCHAEVGH